MRNIMLFVFIFIFIPPAFANSFELQPELCPKAKNADRLDIHRVMQNFGRFSLAADMIAAKTRNPNETWTAMEIKRADEDLIKVLACAQLVLNAQDDQFMPDKYWRFESSHERQAYKEDFLYFMNEFVIEYQEYQKRLRRLPTNGRDSVLETEYFDQYLSANRLIDRAHSKL